MITDTCTVTCLSVWGDLCGDCQQTAIKCARVYVHEYGADARLVSETLISFVNGATTFEEFSSGLKASLPGAVVRME